MKDQAKHKLMKPEAGVIQESPETQKACFIIMPFSETSNYSQDHFKRVFEYLIKPACEEAGFVARRVDENSKTGIIVLEILDMIISSEIAICDISSRNPNVFYELGIRQAFDKSCVIIKDNKTDNPFDISMLRYVEYDASLRIDLIQSKIHDLAKAIQETVESQTTNVNSLVNLLGVKQPAKIPDQTEMTPDMSILLNAINTLSLKVDNIQRSSSARLFRKPLLLPNGETVNVGDKLYSKTDSIINEDYGVIRSFWDNDVIVKQSNGNLIRLPLDEEKIWEQLTKSEYN